MAKQQAAATPKAAPKGAAKAAPAKPEVGKREPSQARLHKQFRETIAPELVKKFGFKSVMQVPRISKITLNMGVSEAVADKKVMDNAVADLTKIAGQKAVVTK